LDYPHQVILSLSQGALLTSTGEMKRPPPRSAFEIPTSLHSNQFGIPPSALHNSAERWLDRLLHQTMGRTAELDCTAGITVALVNLGLLKLALQAEDRFARKVSALVSRALRIVGVWNWITIALIFVWFQPLLLRLNAWRSIAWLGAFAFAFTASIWLYQSGGDSSGSFLLLAVGLMAALPGVALIGWRSRPWMTLIAGALFSATFWFIGVHRPFHLPIWLGNRVFIAVLAANIPYAALLLYGTDLKSKP
jgi:hypothetical protein